VIEAAVAAKFKILRLASTFDISAIERGGEADTFNGLLLDSV
jgi:hypothetical protein